MKTVQTEVPEALYNKAVALVNEGCFRDEKDVFSKAIRLFLDTHHLPYNLYFGMIYGKKK